MVDCDVAERVIRTLREKVSYRGPRTRAMASSMPRSASTSRDGAHSQRMPARPRGMFENLVWPRKIQGRRSATPRPPRVSRCCGGAAGAQAPLRNVKLAHLRRNISQTSSGNCGYLLDCSIAPKVRSHNCPRDPLDEFVKPFEYSGLFLERPLYEQRLEPTM